MICGVLAAGTSQAGVAERVLDAIQQARSRQGVAELVRRADLDSVARSHAEHIAGLTHRDRLAAREDFGGDLEQLGIFYRRVSWHLDLNRGYADPAAQFADGWSSYAPAWSAAVNTSHDRVGIATARAADGWLVLVAVLIEERTPPPEPVPGDLESQTLAAVNAARLERGIAPLALDRKLGDVARSHSLDMIRRRFFGHESPDGLGPAERLLDHGIRYSRVAENVHRSRGADDPVATAVEAWLASPGHRELLLSAEFAESAVGVAVAGDGTIHFTQLFLARPVMDDSGR